MKKHVIVGCLLIVSSMFVSACGNSSDVTTEKTSVTKQVEATGQSTSSSVDQTKYDAIITEAKKLTAEGQYKESEEKLATIPVSDLGKPHYSIVKETVEKLNNQNNEGLKRQEPWLGERALPCMKGAVLERWKSSGGIWPAKGLCRPIWSTI